MKNIIEKLDGHDVHGEVLQLTKMEIDEIIEALTIDLDDLRDAAYDEGRQAGHTEGYDLGHDNGEEAGFSSGYDSGHGDGLVDAKDAMLAAFDEAIGNGMDADQVRAAMFAAWSRL